MPICSKNVTMGIEGFFYTLKNWGKTLYLIQRERYLSKRRTIFPLKLSNIVFGSRPKKKFPQAVHALRHSSFLEQQTCPRCLIVHAFHSNCKRILYDRPLPLPATNFEDLLSNIDMGPNVARSIQVEDEEPKIASKTAYKQF
uniref:Uncharacterized protein n=1 Tax=Glossina palpalis gambiensis TaxID=67801 RepID=A0A1B0C0L1_9MUSC